MSEVTLTQANLRPDPLAVYLIVAIELLVAGLIGLGLVTVGMGGAAWILGGIAAGALVFYVYHALYNVHAQPNRTARKIGQIIIGLTIGLSLQQSHFVTLSSQLPVFLGLPLLLLVGGGIIGVIYSRIERTDLLTAILATTPGNIGVMASMAADYSKNATLVSLIQLVRFTVVIFVMPIIANGAIAHPSRPTLAATLQKLLTIHPQSALLASLVLGIAVLVGYGGDRLKLPMAVFFSAIAVGLSIDLLPLVIPSLPAIDIQMPPLFNLVGQVLLGITIGEFWGINPRLRWSTVAFAVVPVSMTVMTGAIAATLIHWIAHWDWLTCLLVAAPGGSPEMIWIALTLHHDVEIVTAGHLVRLLVLNLSLPLLISLTAYLEKRFPELGDGASGDRDIG